MSLKFAGSDGDQVQFVEDFEELADLEKFLEYEDQLTVYMGAELLQERGISSNFVVDAKQSRGNYSRIIGCGY